jgi:hypothetical protein
MKTVLALVAIGLLLCFQGDAKRFLLEEVTKGKAGVDSSPADVKPTVNGSPLTGSAPTVVANAKNDNNSAEDDKNESYGNYGNPSGSSTETHRIYPTDCQPGKKCP